MRKYILLVFLQACLLSAQPQNALTNDTIVKLVQAGVPSDTIIRTIAAAERVNFRFLPYDLQLFANAKIPDDVFKAMSAKDAGRPVPGFSSATQTPDRTARPVTNALSAPRAATQQPAAAELQSSPPCTYFTVVTQDTLNNVKQGLSADDVKWFQRTFAKKYPGVCYAEPSPIVPVVFNITVTPDVYHGTRIVNQTSTHSDPIHATVSDQSGNTAHVSGTVQTTTTHSTAVPYSVDYGIYTLSVERRRGEGQFEVARRFQQKGLYRTFTLWGMPIAGRGKGKHPVHAVIEDATKWVGGGGLKDPQQSAF